MVDRDARVEAELRGAAAVLADQRGRQTCALEQQSAPVALQSAERLIDVPAIG